MDETASTFIRIIPSLIVWVLGLILSIRMIRHGGTKPEKLFVAGCSLMLFTTLLNPFSRILLDISMDQEGIGFTSVGRTMFLISIPRMVFSLAGFICLIMAFWMKFRFEKPEIR
jgi:hypothetical protein